MPFLRSWVDKDFMGSTGLGLAFALDFALDFLTMVNVCCWVLAGEVLNRACVGFWAKCGGNV